MCLTTSSQSRIRQCQRVDDARLQEAERERERVRVGQWCDKQITEWRQEENIDKFFFLIRHSHPLLDFPFLYSAMPILSSKLRMKWRMRISTGNVNVNKFFAIGLHIFYHTLQCTSFRVQLIVIHFSIDRASNHIYQFCKLHI